MNVIKAKEIAWELNRKEQVCSLCGELCHAKVFDNGNGFEKVICIGSSCCKEPLKDENDIEG